jgi:hypothetical protein
LSIFVILSTLIFNNDQFALFGGLLLTIPIGCGIGFGIEYLRQKSKYGGTMILTAAIGAHLLAYLGYLYLPHPIPNTPHQLGLLHQGEQFLGAVDVTLDSIDMEFWVTGNQPTVMIVDEPVLPLFLLKQYTESGFHGHWIVPNTTQPFWTYHPGRNRLEYVELTPSFLAETQLRGWLVIVFSHSPPQILTPPSWLFYHTGQTFSIGQREYHFWKLNLSDLQTKY